MKLYYKIYVPDENLGPYEASDIRSGHVELCRLYKKENVIVLSIEELKEVWMAGFNRADPENDNGAPTFQTFLKDKGINI